jgi:hypothetical protein
VEAAVSGAAVVATPAAAVQAETGNIN